ncbi:MAG: c-type cytochrome biogenesis protein CcmI [Spongiibacteraceae bacterium]
MPEFYFVAVVLVLLAAAFLLAPVMMNRSQVQSNRKEVNVALYKDRLAELDVEFENGLIDEETLQQLKTELERRLLDEAAVMEDKELEPIKPAFKLALTLAVLVPLLAWGIYQQTGAKADWEISETLKQVRHKVDAGENNDAEVAQLIEQLEARLKQRPEDPHYLMLMGRTQLELGNYPSATDAYQRLSIVFPDDAAALAQYAQALYLSSDRHLTDKVKGVAERALAINDQQPTVLGMLGIANFEAGEYQQAISYWQRLLPMLGPVSPNRRMIEAGIEQARARLVESGEVPESPVDATTELADKPASLQVHVSMADNIQANSSDLVFVFARAATGPRMPLAVARLTVADLPATITLDDSMAMAPGLNLSSFKDVDLVARISKHGIANPGPGDIEGSLRSVEVAAVSGPLLVEIDTVRQ